MNNIFKKGIISLLSLSVLCPVSTLAYTKTESVFSNLNTDGSVSKLVDSNNTYNEYQNRVKKIFFEEYNLSEEEFNKIECVNEIPLEESDEFLSFIQICY